MQFSRGLLIAVSSLTLALPTGCADPSSDATPNAGGAGGGNDGGSNAGGSNNTGGNDAGGNNSGGNTSGGNTSGGNNVGGGTVEAGNCCEPHGTSGCSNPTIQACVCEQEQGYCCDNPWDAQCVQHAVDCGFCDGGGSTDPDMTFFVTSRTVEVNGQPVDGGDFGGLAGADSFCTTLANEALPNNGNTWRAYLSTTTEDARDRIGAGPWFNAEGAQIAASVADLHADPPPTEQLLTESGATFAQSGGGHDVLTGSNSEGRKPTDAQLEPLFKFPDGSFEYPFSSGSYSCANWTSDSNNAYAVTGHLDWNLLGTPAPGVDSDSRSWNASHVTACSMSEIAANGGSTRLYCFATN